MESARTEIIKYIMDTGVAERCVAYQTNKCTDGELINDLKQELYLWLLTYDIAKLFDAYCNRHINALITAWIRNNFHSKSGPFYKNFRKFQDITDEITEKELDIPDN